MGTNRRYLDGDDQPNLRVVLNVMYKTCLPKMNRTQLTLSELNLEDDIKKLIDKLDKFDEKGYYTDCVKDIQRQLTLAKERDKV